MTTLDPKLDLPVVTQNFPIEYKRLFDGVVSWLKNIRTNFQSLDDRATLNADGSTTFITGVGLPVRTVALNTTLDAADFLLLVNAQASAITISLGFPADTPNRLFAVKKIDASANAVKVGPIDGTMQSLTTQHACIVFINDGATPTPQYRAIAEYS